MARSGHRSGWRPSGFDHGPDPEAYFERADGGSPEKRLRLAVLLNAIAQLQRGRGTAVDEAAQWVRGEVAAMHASFSFDAICETLDIDASHLARALLGSVASPSGAKTRLPRRQVQPQRVYAVPRRYRPRARVMSVD